MYNYKQTKQTSLKRNTSYIGEPIEDKIKRITNNKEPITDGAPLIYTNRKEGVLPDYDVRTDRMEYALDAMDKVTKTHIAKREERLKPEETQKDGKTESIQATSVTPKATENT